MHRRVVTAAFLTMCAAVALAGQAHADQYGFISHLDNTGVSYRSVADVINVGKAACHELRSGQSPPAVLGRLQAVGFAPAESSIILAAAVDNMCLDTKAGVVGWAQRSGNTVPT